MPTREYAKEFFEGRLHPSQCPVCGLNYVRGLSTDERYHRSYHRVVVETFEPQPDARLAKLHAKHGDFVPITVRSPAWLHRRLYNIARMLNREMGYFLIMWGQPARHYRDDGHGYVFTDEDGRALGGCAVRWREYTNAAPNWVLQWVWVVPQYRRRGLLRRAWRMLRERHAGIFPEPPFSRGAALFFRECDELPEIIRAGIKHALSDTPEGHS